MSVKLTKQDKAELVSVLDHGVHAPVAYAIIESIINRHLEN